MRRFGSPPTKRRALTLFAALLIGLLLPFIYIFSGIGIDSYLNREGQIVPRTSLWDWLELLLIPLALILCGFWLNSTLQRLERERVEKGYTPNSPAAAITRETPEHWQEEQTLQSYFDRVNDLILKGQFEDPSLGVKAQRVARSWTLSTLPGLDRDGKGALLKFLHQANLITGDSPSIDLSEADFRQANLSYAHLKDANCRQANFEGALIANAVLTGANFEQANLKNASLLYTHLEDANAQFANLQNANLAYAQFGGANLHGAILSTANVEATDFTGANLTIARVTREQLAQAYLDNAILPDGSRYNAPSSTAFGPSSQTSV